VQVSDPQTEEKKLESTPPTAWPKRQASPVWCQDEAGPYQGIPQPGMTWAPQGQAWPATPRISPGWHRQTADPLRPATGEVRACVVETAPNAVLYPWLQQELAEILVGLAHEPVPVTAAPFLPDWWQQRQALPGLRRPAGRLILIWII